jgi:hypothetical protein
MSMADEMYELNKKRIGHCALCFASIYDDEARFETEKGFVYCEKCYHLLKDNQ